MGIFFFVENRKRLGFVSGLIGDTCGHRIEEICEEISAMPGWAGGLSLESEVLAKGRPPEAKDKRARVAE